MSSVTRGRFWRVVVYLASGLAIAGALIAAKVGLEKTGLGRWAEQQTFTLLLNLLSHYETEGRSVVVVDISQLPGGTRNPSTGRLSPTDRKSLQEILDVLEQVGVQSVGIDVDFSPDARGWVDADDERFLDRCLKSKIPVVVGVFRTLREPASAWLGLPKFARLAGSLYIPADGLERIPVWVRDPHRADELPSIGAKLAKAWGGSVESESSSPAKWIHRYSERTVASPVRRDGLVIGEVLTNHAVVNQLVSETIRFTAPRELYRHQEQLRGRMVLLGSTEQASDLFPLPGQDVMRPGAYVHASSAYTLASQPIYEFSHAARLVLDGAIASIALLVVALGRLGSTQSSPAAEHHAEQRVQRGAIALVVLGGFAIVWIARVMWLDFLLVAATLVLHPIAERYLKSLGRARTH